MLESDEWSQLERLTRTHFTSVPFWELVSRLKRLHLGFREDAIAVGASDHDDIAISSEVSEQELTSFELPKASLPQDVKSVAALRDAVACRTIVAAARGGQLTHLEIEHSWIQKPFAVRQLLPFWVNIQDWGYSFTHGYCDELAPALWLQAAATLRSALAHASRWLPASGGGIRYDRTLTGEDLRAWYAHFKTEGKPSFIVKIRLLADSAIVHPIEQYLAWLETDAELAQQVADAWNAVVRRGEEDLVKCCCEKCGGKVAGVWLE